MIRTILWWILWGFILILVLLWLVSGGPRKVITAASQLKNPLGGSGTTTFELPWQITMPRGPDITPLVQSYDAQYGGSVQSDQTLPDQTSAPSENPDLGQPSPYAGRVRISIDGVRESSPGSEYLTLSNDGLGQLDINGWSLQSALTGVRAYIPRGASFFKLGAINQQADIVLRSGGNAIVTTGYSPVGTSFLENECTGYLNQLQTYAPPLSEECPAPSDTLVETGAGLAILGDSCYNFVQSLPSCRLPQTVPSNLNTSCRLFLANTFSYNGCVDTYERDSSFSSSEWRVYLGSPRELWRNTHDVIRLLDANGLTVAAVSY